MISGGRRRGAHVDDINPLVATLHGEKRRRHEKGDDDEAEGRIISSHDDGVEDAHFELNK